MRENCVLSWNLPFAFCKSTANSRKGDGAKFGAGRSRPFPPQSLIERGHRMANTDRSENRRFRLAVLDNEGKVLWSAPMIRRGAPREGFPDGNPFKSGSLGYHVGGFGNPLVLDGAGHTVNCTVTQYGTKGSFAEEAARYAEEKKRTKGTVKGVLSKAELMAREADILDADAE